MCCKWHASLYTHLCIPSVQMHHTFLVLYTCTIASRKNFCCLFSSLLRQAYGSSYWMQTGCIGKDCKALFNVVAISLLFSSVGKKKKNNSKNQKPQNLSLPDIFLPMNNLCFTTLCSLNLCHINACSHTNYYRYFLLGKRC